MACVFDAADELGQLGFRARQVESLDFRRDDIFQLRQEPPPTFGIAVGLIEQGAGDWGLTVSRDKFVEARSTQAQLSACVAERNAGNSGHFDERSDRRLAATGYAPISRTGRRQGGARIGHGLSPIASGTRVAGSDRLVAKVGWKCESPEVW